MAGTQTTFDKYLAEEVRKYRGIMVPVRVGLLQRIFVHSVPTARIHPNPEDEFCDPAIGPNYEIISRYERDIADRQRHNQTRYFSEALIGEKVRPDGYMLLNGHHRWAAAVRRNISRVPLRLVNLTHIEDIRRMLDSSQNTRRVTLDLDEVVFCQDESVPAEKALPFPFRLLCPERIRLGVPALFHFLNSHGWDIWVYTARFTSVEYMHRLFHLYRMHVTGIVTGSGRAAGLSLKARRELSEQFANRYDTTFHIDSTSAVRVDRNQHKYEEYTLSGEPSAWSGDVMDAITASIKKEG